MPLEIRGAHFLIRNAQLVRKTGLGYRIGPEASAVLAMGLCLLVASRSSTKTPERIELIFGM